MKAKQLLLASLLCASVCWAYEDKTAAKYLEDNGYSQLVNLLKQAHLYSVLDGSGPFTVFAPTDAAFAKLDQASLQTLVNNPSQLVKLLKYHVIPEFILQPTVRGFASKQTLEGQTVNITESPTTFVVNGVANVGRTKDIIVKNGVVQPIDTVLTPPKSSEVNIAQVLIQNDKKFADFYLALTILDLTQLLEVPGSQFTVFAPVDSAFPVFNDSSLNYVQDNATFVHKELFKYHIVPGTKFSQQLTPHVPVYTLHGQPLTITSSAAGLMVDNAHVIEADIPASNGVIHVIDSIMAPTDILRP